MLFGVSSTYESSSVGKAFETECLSLVEDIMMQWGEEQVAEHLSGNFVLVGNTIGQAESTEEDSSSIDNAVRQ